MSSLAPLTPAAQSSSEFPPAPPVRQFARLPQRTPYVVYAILLITISVYILQSISSFGSFLGFQGSLGPLTSLRCPYLATRDLPACYGMKVNELIIAGQWWRLITPVLLHASLLHVGFNMYALFILGPELERHFGHLSFLALYVLSGFAGVVLSFLLTDAPSLGASTSVFGLLAAQGVFAYRNQKVFGRRARAALRSIINIAVINLIIGLSPGIDNWGHFGGLLGGLVFSGIASPSYSLAGDEMELELKNNTPSENFYYASFAVGAIFLALAFWGFVR